MVAELKNLKTGQDRIETKLDNFIDSADKKYATKTELSVMKNMLDAENERQNNLLKSRGEKLWDVVKVLLPYVLAALVVAMQVGKI